MDLADIIGELLAEMDARERRLHRALFRQVDKLKSRKSWLPWWQRPGRN